MPDKTTPVIKEFKIADMPKGAITRLWLHIVSNGIGVPIHIPIIVARGLEDGKIFGLTAAVHGNELNGIPVIQRLFKEIDVKTLRGTIVGVPVVNIPSLLRNKRRFIDGTDLNHIMPGKADGNVSQVYAWRIVHRIVKKFDYLMDLHTASNGRVNSYYIRADMEDETVRKMALLQNAQIIVHNPPSDGTLRGTADEMGIPAITLEVGNPNTFQKGRDPGWADRSSQSAGLSGHDGRQGGGTRRRDSFMQKILLDLYRYGRDYNSPSSSHRLCAKGRSNSYGTEYIW